MGGPMASRCLHGGQAELTIRLHRTQQRCSCWAPPSATAIWPLTSFPDVTCCCLLMGRIKRNKGDRQKNHRPKKQPSASLIFIWIQTTAASKFDQLAFKTVFSLQVLTEARHWTRAGVLPFSSIQASVQLPEWPWGRLTTLWEVPSLLKFLIGEPRSGLTELIQVINELLFSFERRNEPDSFPIYYTQAIFSYFDYTVHGSNTVWIWFASFYSVF